MEPLADITDKTLGIDKPLPKAPNVRKAARTVLFDGAKVAIIHISKRSYHKIPGGGLEKGEDAMTALRRELLEEAGCETRITSEVGTIIEHRYSHNREQHNSCFLAEVEKKGLNAPTKDERKDGLELLWVAPQEAIRLFESDRTEDYGRKFMSRRDLIFLRKALEKRAVQ